MPELDHYDRALLRLLQDDGRLSNRDLAARVNLSPSPCWRRVKQLEATGVISGYRAVLDPALLGLSLTVFAHVTLDDHHPDTVRSFNAVVDNLPEVQECHMVSGEYDYVLKIVATDMNAYSDTLRAHLLQAPGVNRISSTFVMQSPKVGQLYPVYD